MKRKERSRGEEAGRVPHGAFLTGRVSGLLPGESLWAEWAGWAGGAAVRDDRDRPAHRREVHFALENDGWNCTFECEVHVSAPGVQVAVAAARTAHPGVRGGTGCPNLLQRPGSRRSAGEESLIFRGSYRGRSRRGAPLQQIWTRPRPGPPQEPHQHHPGRVRPRTMELRPRGAPPAPS